MKALQLTFDRDRHAEAAQEPQHRLREQEGPVIRYQWSAVPYLLCVLLLLVPPARIHAAPLLAESQTVVNCLGTIDGSNIPLPGFMSSTCSVLFPVSGGTTGSDANATTAGWLSGTGAPGNPLQVGKAEVSGSNTGSLGGNMSASAQVLFYFDLVTIGVVPPPVGTVTINIEVSGGGTATGISGQYYSQARTDWGVNGAFTNELITTTFNPGPPFAVVHTIDFIDDAITSPLDWDGLIWLTASCSAGGGPGATCDSFVDPIFSFADPGFADFYAFNFSPNITIIPVPAAIWLFGSSLLGLIGSGLTRRR